jgi:hypothetical protein
VKSYGPTQDEDGIPLGRAPDAVIYDRQLLLWERKIGNGKLTCELLRPNRPGRRLVRLTGRYTDSGDEVCVVAVIDSEDDERLTALRLEQRMLAAQVRPAA